MNDTGWWRLLIRGQDQNFSEIEAMLGIKATSAFKKGHHYDNNEIFKPLTHDVWIFSIDFDDCKSSEQALEELLSLLKPSAEYLQQLSRNLSVQLRWFIQSDYAQIYFELPANLLKALSDMNLKLEISIFSWGGVEDGDGDSLTD